MTTTDTKDRGKYVTLSHRWGIEHRLELTATTMNALTEGIDFDSLPPSHQDAVIVSRYLGPGYHTLCIVQDDDKIGLGRLLTWRQSTINPTVPLAADDNFGFLSLNGSQERNGFSRCIN